LESLGFYGNLLRLM